MKNMCVCVYTFGEVEIQIYSLPFSFNPRKWSFSENTQNEDGMANLEGIFWVK